MTDIENVKELTFYMGDKPDDELWKIVADACRGSTRTWRAYERLHGTFTHLQRMEKAYSKLWTSVHGAIEEA